MTGGSAGNQRSWASLLFGLVNLSEQVRAYRDAELIVFVFVTKASSQTLPVGVPGAIRLYVNLLSVGHATCAFIVFLLYRRITVIAKNSVES